MIYISKGCGKGDQNISQQHCLCADNYIYSEYLFWQK